MHGLAVCQHGVGKEAYTQDEEQVEQEQKYHLDDEANLVRESHDLLETAEPNFTVCLLQVALMLVAKGHHLRAIATLGAHIKHCLVGLEQF